MMRIKSYGGMPKLTDLLERAIRDVGFDPLICHPFELIWDYDSRSVLLKVTPTEAGSDRSTP